MLRALCGWKDSWELDEPELDPLLEDLEGLAFL